MTVLTRRRWLVSVRTEAVSCCSLLADEPTTWRDTTQLESLPCPWKAPRSHRIRTFLLVLLPLEPSETGAFPLQAESKHLRASQPFHQLSYFFFNPQRGFSVMCIHRNATSIIWNCSNERKHGPIKVRPPTLLTVITE